MILYQYQLIVFLAMDETPQFVCERCHHKSSCKGNLLKHLSKARTCPPTHSDIGCEELVKRLTRVSTKSKTFGCELCSKAFSTAQGKSQHKKVCPKRPEKEDKRRLSQLELTVVALQQDLADIKAQYSRDVLLLKSSMNSVQGGTFDTETNQVEVASENGNVPLENKQQKKKKVTFCLRKNCWN